MKLVVEYIDMAGRSPFGMLVRYVDARAAAKVRTAIVRLEQGNELKFLNPSGAVSVRRD